MLGKLAAGIEVSTIFVLLMIVTAPIVILGAIVMYGGATKQGKMFYKSGIGEALPDQVSE